jgi:hypothetical protein
MHEEMQASSVHASPHAMSAEQSASDAHALSSEQQLASTHVSQVGSPVDRPHAPAPASAPPGPPDRSEVPLWPPILATIEPIAPAPGDALLNASFA